MADRKFEDSTFSIELNYSKDKDNPVAVFESFKLMFESVIKTQTELVRKINPLLNVDFVLTDIKSASIWASLTRKTLTVEDEKNTLLLDETKGDVNEYVNRSTELFVQKMAESKDKVIHSSDIISLTNKINEIAKETKINESPNYKSPNMLVLAEAFEKAKSATKLLSSEDSFDFIREGQEPISVIKVQTEIDKNDLVTEEKEKVVERDILMTLKIKMADFLGTAKWKFLTEDEKLIDAKIDDSGWLDNFHNNGSMALTSGDSLKIEGTVKETFDNYGKLIEAEYTIKKAKGIVHNEN